MVGVLGESGVVVSDRFCRKYFPDPLCLGLSGVVESTVGEDIFNRLLILLLAYNPGKKNPVKTFHSKCHLHATCVIAIAPPPISLGALYNNTFKLNTNLLADDATLA